MIMPEIRGMVKACNQYLDDINKVDLPHIIYKSNDKWADLNFDSAMKRFRNSFRIAISNIEFNSKLESNILIPEKW